MSKYILCFITLISYLALGLNSLEAREIYAPDATVRTTTAIENQLGFNSSYHDDESNLQYKRARYYSPNQGRFVNRDPIGYYDGLSLYAGYFADNFNLDPSGTSETKAKKKKTVCGDGWKLIVDGRTYKKETRIKQLILSSIMFKGKQTSMKEHNLYAEDRLFLSLMAGCEPANNTTTRKTKFETKTGIQVNAGLGAFINKYINLSLTLTGEVKKTVENEYKVTGTPTKLRKKMWYVREYTAQTISRQKKYRAVPKQRIVRQYYLTKWNLDENIVWNANIVSYVLCEKDCLSNPKDVSPKDVKPRDVQPSDPCED